MALIYLLQLSLLLTLDTAQIYGGFVVNCEFFLTRHRHVCKIVLEQTRIDPRKSSQVNWRKSKKVQKIHRGESSNILNIVLKLQQWDTCKLPFVKAGNLLEKHRGYSVLCYHRSKLIFKKVVVIEIFFIQTRHFSVMFRIYGIANPQGYLDSF